MASPATVITTRSVTAILPAERHVFSPENLYSEEYVTRAETTKVWERLKPWRITSPEEEVPSPKFQSISTGVNLTSANLPSMAAVLKWVAARARNSTGSPSAGLRLLALIGAAAGLNLASAVKTVVDCVALTVGLGDGFGVDLGAGFGAA